MSRARPLTDRALRALREPGDYSVGGVAGLVLRVRASSKTFVLRYRSAGRRRSYTLGHYPKEVSLAEARDKAAVLRKRIRNGDDPVAEKSADNEAMRVVELFGNDQEPGWYLGTYVQTAGRIGTARTEQGIYCAKCRIGKHLREKTWLRKRVSDVTVADLNKIKSKVRPGTWRKLREILQVCFRHCEEIGVIEHGANPVARTTASQSRKIERYLTPDERRRLDGILVKSIPGEDETHTRPGRLGVGYALAIRLLLLTGMRRGEVVNLRWEHVDWKNGQLALPTSKTGAKRVPLTPQAIKYLRDEHGPELGRLGPICLTAEGTDLRGDNLTRAWIRIRKLAGLKDVRLHDFRHSWASDAISAGVPLHVVGKVLGHKTATTTARYAHLHDRAVQEGLAAAGDAIEIAQAGKAK